MGFLRITAGAFRGRSIKTCDADAAPGYRPATAMVREAVFSMLESLGQDWARTSILDLYAGSGSLGFEALSRGAGLVWFVEQDAKAAKLIATNLEALEIERSRTRILARDLFTVLNQRQKLNPPLFHLAFIDPPYGRNLLERTVRPLRENGWLAPGALIVAEVEARVSAENLADAHGLELLRDRTYGQTRIVLWKDATDWPSTPEPSTP